MEQPSNQVCPTCGLPPQHTVTSTTDRIVTATLVCALDHLWLVKWAEQPDTGLRGRIERAAAVMTR